MPSRLNELMLDELKEQFADVDTCVFVDFSGLSGRQAVALRDQLRARCGERAVISVVKTSLARRAFAETEHLSAVIDGEMASVLDGPTAVAYGADDPAVLAKAIAEWAKKEKLTTLKGGVLAGRPLPADAASRLAQIPPRPVLMGQVIGSAAGPLRAALGIARTMIRRAVSVVDALAKQKSEDGESSGDEE
ncbi:MAG: 50S ribosomal protein L10 [Planctomycetota bacterium]